MTKEECVQVLWVISTVDRGCVDCIIDLLTELRSRMPDAPWLEALQETDGMEYGAATLWQESNRSTSSGCR